RLCICRLPTVDLVDDHEPPAAAEQAEGVARRDRVVAARIVRAEQLGRVLADPVAEPSQGALNLGPVAAGDQVDGLELARQERPQAPVRRRRREAGRALPGRPSCAPSRTRKRSSFATVPKHRPRAGARPRTARAARGSTGSAGTAGRRRAGRPWRGKRRTSRSATRARPPRSARAARPPSHRAPESRAAPLPAPRADSPGWPAAGANETAARG